MQEHDTRKQATDLAEFITPPKLREFLQSKIQGNNLTVLEPSIGSGQLLFKLADSINHIDGYDVNELALQSCKNNFQDKVNIHNQDFIVSDINKEYDIAIANYPFSLKPTQAQKEYIANHKFLKQFYYKGNIGAGLFGNVDYESVVKDSNITGKLDIIFILKSFYHAKEGLYLCFPGIGYRGQEEKFRKYLIENKFIKEIGIINETKFNHTPISILFLHITKTPNETTKSFALNLQTGEKIEKVATFENNTFDFPKKDIPKEVVDAVELEVESRNATMKNLIKQIQASRNFYNIDAELRNKLPTIEEWKKELIKIIEEC